MLIESLALRTGSGHHPCWLRRQLLLAGRLLPVLVLLRRRHHFAFRVCIVVLLLILFLHQVVSPLRSRLLLFLVPRFPLRLLLRLLLGLLLDHIIVFPLIDFNLRYLLERCFRLLSQVLGTDLLPKLIPLGHHSKGLLGERRHWPLLSVVVGGDLYHVAPIGPLRI